MSLTFTKRLKFISDGEGGSAFANMGHGVTTVIERLPR
jgi:hypothetical protein